MHARITTLFVDDGGVMSDNAQRAPEYQRLVAEFFVPRLGGKNAAWREANRVVFEKLLREVLTAGPEGQDYRVWWEAYQVQWVTEMAAVVGVALSGDDARCLKLACEAIDYITERVRASYPGAVETIRVLHGMGFRLFMASAGHSRELEGFLKGMGIRRYFDTLYGADLVNHGKYSIEYYRRVFAHSDVAPERALVVDDNPHNLAWAASLGAATCLVSFSPPQGVQTDFVVSKLSELPAALTGRYDQIPKE